MYVLPPIIITWDRDTATVAVDVFLAVNAITSCRPLVLLGSALLTVSAVSDSSVVCLSCFWLSNH